MGKKSSMMLMLKFKVKQKQHILTTAIIMQAKPCITALLCQNHHPILLKLSTEDMLKQE